MAVLYDQGTSPRQVRKQTAPGQSLANPHWQAIGMVRVGIQVETELEPELEPYRRYLSRARLES